MPRVWCLQRAHAEIDAQLADPNLDAARVADQQHISRRRLAEIFRAELGPKITFPARTCDLKPWRANDVNSIWMVLEFHRE
jgi:hypothetical protein